MAFVLQPHQVSNVEILFRALVDHGGALDGSDTGTGKTYTFVGLCRKLGARPAIVTRKALIPQWKAACREGGVDPLFIVNYEGMRSAKFPFGKLVEGPRGGKKYVWDIKEPRVLFAFDEAQSLRGFSTINSLAAIEASRHWKVVLLSATPFQTPLEARTIGIVTRLFTDHTYYRWMFQHGVKKNYFGQLEFIGDIKDPLGKNREKAEKFMAEIRDSIFPSRGCRTRREDIPGFPETLVLCEAIETDAAAAITRHYLHEIEERRKADHARACRDVDPEFHDLVAPLSITVNLRDRQEAELLKCPAIAEVAKLEAEKGASVAVFVNFDASVEVLADLLKTKYIVRGDGSGRIKNNYNRAEVIRAFQENYAPFIIVNVAAGGVGLSLHDPVERKPRVALISPPYSAVMLKQVLGRVQRLGGGGSTQKILFAAGTIEEKVMERVRSRLANLDTLLDTDLIVT